MNFRTIKVFFITFVFGYIIVIIFLYISEINLHGMILNWIHVIGAFSVANIQIRIHILDHIEYDHVELIELIIYIQNILHTYILKILFHLIRVQNGKFHKINF